jgi:hypothetical protein
MGRPASGNPRGVIGAVRLTKHEADALVALGGSVGKGLRVLVNRGLSSSQAGSRVRHPSAGRTEPSTTTLPAAPRGPSPSGEKPHNHEWVFMRQIHSKADGGYVRLYECEKCGTQERRKK